MALIKCPDCGNQISDMASTCIHCGRPLDDVLRKVIRKCGTGEIVLIQDHLTLTQAQELIYKLTHRQHYEYSYIYKSGSQYSIIPDTQSIDVVTDLKRVVRIENNSAKICEARGLTPSEADDYMTQLRTENNELIRHLAASGWDNSGARIRRWFAADDTETITETQDTPSVVTRPVTRPAGPRCPTCGSTSIERISTTAKAAGAVAFGVFSKTARSQFRCRNCGYKW